MKSYYDAGEQLRVKVTFTSGGIATDPTAISFFSLGYIVGAMPGTPDELVYGVDVEVVKESTGVYYVDFQLVADNSVYEFRWEGTGDVAAAVEGKVRTRVSNFI